jgi:hypothetical protein
MARWTGYRGRDILCTVEVGWAEDGLARRGTVVSCCAGRLTKEGLGYRNEVEDR